MKAIPHDWWNLITLLRCVGSAITVSPATPKLCFFTNRPVTWLTPSCFFMSKILADTGYVSLNPWSLCDSAGGDGKEADVIDCSTQPVLSPWGFSHTNTTLTSVHSSLCVRVCITEETLIAPTSGSSVLTSLSVSPQRHCGNISPKDKKCHVSSPLITGSLALCSK